MRQSPVLSEGSSVADRSDHRAGNDRARCPEQLINCRQLTLCVCELFDLSVTLSMRSSRQNFSVVDDVPDDF